MGYDVILLPSFGQAQAWLKRLAHREERGLFAQKATTFDAWIADLWELHGDGRAIVGDMQREIMMYEAFRDAGGVFAAPGMAPMAAACMARASGVDAFERALDSARRGTGIEGLSEREGAFVSLLARYEDMLGSLGLIEIGAASSALACDAAQVFPHPLKVLSASVTVESPVQKQFFESCSRIEHHIEFASGVDGVPCASDDIDVRFAFPSGKLAEPGIIADLIRGRAAEGARGDAVVACKDPVALFGRLSPALIREGFSVCLEGRAPFSGTDFGKAFLAMYRCLHDDPWNPAFLTDVLYTPFSGASRADVRRIDRIVRADRVAEKGEQLARVRAEYEPFSQLEELATDPDADVLIGSFEQMAHSMHRRTAAWRSEQLAAMGVLRDAMKAARGAGAGIDACAAVLERASVPVSARPTFPDGPDTSNVECGASAFAPSVVITDQQGAARRGPRSCSLLVVADLTSQDYPVADRDGAASTLLEKLGVRLAESSLTLARATFTALLGLPSERIVLSRPMGDADAAETYASVVLEEFIDNYRPDPTDPSDIDNRYRIPESLTFGLMTRGEEELYANALAAPVGAQQPVRATGPVPRIDDLGVRGVAQMALHRKGKGGSPERFAPSPSQIEAYLECPFKWFATKRLRPEELDEGFGPVEQGLFAHKAIEVFYRRFQEEGHAKVDAGNVVFARSLMGEVVDGLARAQRGIEPGERRLVAKDELERREVASLRRRLIAFLDFEMRLLPTFRPVRFEFPVNAEYAGHPLIGVVDRVDVDERGHAAIIDYKGSLGCEHEIAGKSALHVGKVQTRMYAKAVARALDVKVVAVLYMSYGKDHALSGAYDPSVVEEVHLPFMNRAKCRCVRAGEIPDPLPAEFPFAALGFDRMLDATEEIVGVAIEDMRAGAIAPAPSHAEACKYCPTHMCPNRRKGGG